MGNIEWKSGRRFACLCVLFSIRMTSLQRQQAADENWDGSGKRKVWKCSSALSHMTISSYAKYQESYGQTSSSEVRKTKNIYFNGATVSKEEEIAVSARQFKTIQFGTNADLSDEIT